MTINCFKHQPCQAATMACLGWCMVQATTWPARASARMLSMTHRAWSMKTVRNGPSNNGIKQGIEPSKNGLQPWTKIGVNWSWSKLNLDTQDGSLYHPNLEINPGISTRKHGDGSLLWDVFLEATLILAHWQWCPLNLAKQTTGKHPAVEEKTSEIKSPRWYSDQIRNFWTRNSANGCKWSM